MIGLYTSSPDTMPKTTLSTKGLNNATASLELWKVAVEMGVGGAGAITKVIGST
jgi:hypothetical protein